MEKYIEYRFYSYTHLQRLLSCCHCDGLEGLWALNTSVKAQMTHSLSMLYSMYAYMQMFICISEKPVESKCTPMYSLYLFVCIWYIALTAEFQGHGLWEHPRSDYLHRTPQRAKVMIQLSRLVFKAAASWQARTGGILNFDWRSKLEAPLEVLCPDFCFWFVLWSPLLCLS